MGWGMAAVRAAAQQAEQKAQEELEENKRGMGYTQWTEISEGAGYTASGKTVDALPPGLYDINVINGAIIWVPVRARHDNILRFPDSAVSDVVGEIETFWEREEVFMRHVLPFKRGILLWGPPGSGKSSTLQLLARDVIERGGIVIMFNSAEIFLGAYRQLRDIQPEVPVVVLMEDLDTILNRSSGTETKVLNLLDGVEHIHKVVFVATTNYPQKLGGRIINRPSRFDRRYKIPHPSEASRKMYLETLVLPEDDIDVDRVVKDTEGMSLAHLKEFFVAVAIIGTPYDKALKMLRKMKEKISDLDDEEEFERETGTGPYV